MRPVDPSARQPYLVQRLVKLRAEAGLRLPADGFTGRVVAATDSGCRPASPDTSPAPPPFDILGENPAKKITQHFRKRSGRHVARA